MSNTQKEFLGLGPKQQSMMLSVGGLGIATVIFIFYRPAALFQLFFIYQMVVQCVHFVRTKGESRLLEFIFLAPAKLLVASAAVSFLPKDNSTGGLVLIGVSLLFLLSGVENFYRMAKILTAQQESINTYEPMVSAAQQKRTDHLHETLLADLTGSLDDDQKGKRSPEA